jgi:hypothetical protein
MGDGTRRALWEKTPAETLITRPIYIMPAKIFYMLVLLIVEVYVYLAQRYYTDWIIDQIQMGY